MLEKNLAKLKRTEVLVKKWKAKVRRVELAIAKHRDQSSKQSHVESTNPNFSELGLAAHL